MLSTLIGLLAASPDLTPSNISIFVSLVGLFGLGINFYWHADQNQTTTSNDRRLDAIQANRRLENSARRNEWLVECNSCVRENNAGLRATLVAHAIEIPPQIPLPKPPELQPIDPPPEMPAPPAAAVPLLGLIGRRHRGA